MNIPPIILMVFVGVLVAAGTYLTLERSLSRIFIGLGLITNGVNLLILTMGGSAGLPPLLGGAGSRIVDPLPQALILTSIVLSIGTTAFGLALAYRSWLLTGNDEVVDDVEDRRLARRAARLDREIDDVYAEGTEDPQIFYDRDDTFPYAASVYDPDAYDPETYDPDALGLDGFSPEISGPGVSGQRVSGQRVSGQTVSRQSVSGPEVRGARSQRLGEERKESRTDGENTP